MPKRHYEPEKLFEIDGVTVWHTYDAGCGPESDKRLGFHYTLDAEQAEPGMGTSHHFDVRDLPSYVEDRGPWAAGSHAIAILVQLIDDPSMIPLGEEWLADL
jgi:hypothetical protein